MTVHPRGRGEHTDSCAARAARRGSSPRARGTPWWRCRRTGGFRFIPAGAGNTIIVIGRHPLAQVHPRGRGEHGRGCAGPAWPAGSSPRARGTLSIAGLAKLDQRFIPAGAGNTSRDSASRSGKTVHPRGRGEHCRSASYCNCSIGSSPRARGTPCQHPMPRPVDRFIPAGAGNTILELLRWRPTTGSSPRARGTRISPSDVGNCSPVHPRGRGEHEA